jgi:hypothetical protein
MTNAQIVAELGWTREIIKKITGVTPTTMRAPFGDMDDRVRAISLAMGLQPIQWTRGASGTFDTNGQYTIPVVTSMVADRLRLLFRLACCSRPGYVNPADADFRGHPDQRLGSQHRREFAGVVLRIFERLMIFCMQFIVLEHDLYEQAVELAIGYTLDTALKHNPPFSVSPYTRFSCLTIFRRC